MTIKVIVFDLDDTLFDELDYVRSGLRHTASVLSEKFRWDPEDTERQLLSSLTVSRNQVFDRVLAQKGVLSEELIQFCVTTYREHWPSIRLSNRVKRHLKELAKSFPLYIVTDGHGGVQKTKLEVLGLLNSDFIKFCYATDDWGQDYVKPSPKCFNDVALKESCQPAEIVYIADNPDKDFVGIKPEGFRTIRIMSGQHKNKSPGQAYEADIQVADLFEAISYIKSVTGDMQHEV